MNDELAKMDRSLPKPELFARMSALIDKRIHASYRMYPNNYVAHDLLEGKEDFSDHYTAEDKQRFTAYIEQQLERISIPNKDVDFCAENAADVCQPVEELSGGYKRMNT